MSNFFSVAGGIHLTETSFMVLAFLILGLPFIIMSFMGAVEVFFLARKHLFGHEETGNVTLPELLEQAAAKSNAATSVTSTSTS